MRTSMLLAVNSLLVGLLLASCYQTTDDCKNLNLCPPPKQTVDGSVPDPETGGASPLMVTGGAGTVSGGQGPVIGSGGTSGGGATGTAGATAEGGSAGAAPVCDTSAPPELNPCVISEDIAVFVSPLGSDAGNGTRAAPYRTLAQGIAKAGGKRIYACTNRTGELFDEALVFTSANDNLAIYGGFDCNGWEYSTTKRITIESPSTVGMVARGVDNLRLFDVEIRAKSATIPGGSSIAFFATRSANIKLTRVRLKAGNGVAGIDGSREDYQYPPLDLLKGRDGGDSDPTECSFTCPGPAPQLATLGGSRGRGTPDRSGGRGLPIYSALAGGLGGVAPTVGCAAGTVGSDGANGRDGMGAIRPGTLTEEGWTPAPGTDGVAGTVGQGGGGGSSGPTTGIGGGGGCGACGGAGTVAGTGGGSSIAVLSFESTVTLGASELVTGNAGSGGKAIEGQVGQSSTETGGGAGGLQVQPGCPGGNGGKGGKGGSAGGGAGGMSLGVFYIGPAPRRLGGGPLTLGDAGLGGEGLPDKPNSKGLDGKRAEELPVPSN